MTEKGQCHEEFKQDFEANARHQDYISKEELEYRIKAYLNDNPCTSSYELALIFKVDEKKIKKISEKNKLNNLFG